jgi:hypothetical protein
VVPRLSASHSVSGKFDLKTGIFRAKVFLFLFFYGVFVFVRFKGAINKPLQEMHANKNPFHRRAGEKKLFSLFFYRVFGRFSELKNQKHH